jgi:hypothetical protein
MTGLSARLRKKIRANGNRVRDFLELVRDFLELVRDFLELDADIRLEFQILIKIYRSS